MAGRPVTLYGGQPGLLYGLIAFAALSVIFLGLFIFQLTRIKEAENRAQAAESKLAQYGRPPAQYYVDEATARRTNVFAVMADDLKRLATLVTGVPEDVAPTVLAKSAQTLEEIAAANPGTIDKTMPLLEGLRELAGFYQQQQRKVQELEARSGQLQADKEALTQQLKATRDEFEAQVANLSKQFQQAQQEKVVAVQQKDAQLRELQATLEATEAALQKEKREGNALVREKEIEIGQLQTLIADLQKQIQALKPGTFDPRAILTKADGRILRAIPGSDVVYINLGAADRIRPGMGFEVYSPTHQVAQGLRGKASLEVVALMEESAECRVTRRVPGQPIMEGDIVVNIAFERTRQPKFVVQGDFDLNYDGVIDYNGVEQVAAMIRQWGGQVVQELDESVDFVVIGLPPTVPETAGEGPASEIVRDQAVQKQLEQSRFRALVERAQKMFIPVITQNQFLFLTGYAGDTGIYQP